MKIILNGERADTSAKTLKELCVTLGYEETGIATAVDGNFVNIKDRQTVELTENAQIEIVSPRQGG